MGQRLFTETVSAVVENLGTDAKQGLTAAAASARLARDGANKLAEATPLPWWRNLLDQFNQLVIWILIGATIVSGILGDWLEAGAIFAIVLLNALLGFFQERKAEEALSSLRKLSSPSAKVLRDGALHSIEAQELVCGDVVELEAGDRVPADVRLIRTFGLKTQEAALTGESTPVEKEAEIVLPDESTIAEQINMAFMGTSAVAGKGRGVVAATGMKSELGRIAGFLQSEEREPTPLQKRLEELGRVLIVACLALVALIFVLQLLRGEKLAHTFLMAVSLAVAAVPEGLPAVVTIALALGLQRMVKRNALIRRLASVETLGSVTVICSDKTGTLTRNEMTVTEIVTASENYRVTGSGYAPEGEFMAESSGRVDPRTEPELLLALQVGLWCNNSQLEPPDESDGRWRIVGDPTEGALVVVAGKAGLKRNSAHTIVHEIPFDSQRKLMSAVVREAGQGTTIYTKGAPELLLERCAFEQRPHEIVPLSPPRREEILQQSRAMANHALRVLGLACRGVDENFKTHGEHDLIFTGLVGMIDPPREEARIAVGKCKSAGIRPVMITGDHPATALAVARQAGIAREQDAVVSGAQLDALSDEELAGEVDRIPVYARVSPEHKLRVVKALKARGEVVAMTGDGVNDAPAVKTADIGIAMGITGTDVTKEASDMVLTDDNFASIVNAVEEGRGIYDNIQEVVHYLLSSNASEILLVLLAAVIGWPVPLIPIQLLWINLITDGIPALALAMEKPAADVMRRRPRPPNEPFFTRERGTLIVIHGLLMASVMVAGFGYAYGKAGVAYAQAAVFYITTFSQLFFSFACRSQRCTLPQLGLFSNPYLLGAIVVSGLLQMGLLWLPLTQGVFFGTPPQFGFDWLVIFGLALTPVSIVEIVKIIQSRCRTEATAEGGA
jgi:P-type Ca2+ transporter type 2C